MELSERMLSRVEIFMQQRADPNAVPATTNKIAAWAKEVAQLEAKLKLYHQRIVFEQACSIAEIQCDYNLAAYMLRDLPLTESAGLADLAHAMHQETCSAGDWRGLRDLWDKAYREALGGE